MMEMMNVYHLVMLMIIDDKHHDHEHDHDATLPRLFFPFYISTLFERKVNTIFDLIKPESYNAIDVFRSKTKFAAYVACKCYDFRDGFVDALCNGYKRVDGWEDVRIMWR